MKKLLIGLLALMGAVCPELNAQNEQLEQKVLNALATLDQSQCPSGRLYERVPEYYPFAYWRGNYVSDSTSFLISRFSMAIGMLHTMDINHSSGLPDMNTIVFDAQRLRSSDTVRMGVILYNYHRFDTGAITRQLISYQGDHFYDVPGRTESPYQPDTVFGFSMFNHLSNSLDQKFMLPNDYVFASFGFSSLAIDFDDGLGLRVISIGQLIAIHYSDYGVKRIRCRITDVNGKDYTAQSFYEIQPNTCGLDYNIDPDDSAHLDGVNLYWWYNKNCEDRKVRKPLILIEGFDPLNKNGPGLVFKKYSDLNTGLLNNDYKDENGKLLSEYLHQDEYDIFYIDYKLGHIDIRDNAFYVKQAINWINARKHKDGSYEKNIVIGASMGGLVGYWALKSMENSNIDHEAELYLTVDSPLKGANIPVGMQAFVQELGDYNLVGTRLKNYGNQDVFDKDGNGLLKGQFALNSPAANQMLYYHYDSDTWTPCGGTEDDCLETFAIGLSKKHDAFFNEFNALGNLNVKHYAISNGSILRKGQQFGIGAKLADATLSTNELLKQAGFNNFWSTTVELLAATILSTGFFSEHIVYAVNVDGSQLIYKGKYGTFILFIPITKIIKRYLKDSKPYDSAPGGMRVFEDGLAWKYESFGFIPTISALRLNTEDPYYYDIYELDDVNKTILNGRTSVSCYSGSIEQKPFFKNGTLFWNEDHVSLNKRLAEYLKTLVGYNVITVSDPLDINTFNYGNIEVTTQSIIDNQKIRIRNVLNYDLTIKNLGKLWVNRYDRIGYTNNSNNKYNGDNVTYDLNVIQDCIDTTVVQVKDGGILQIGDMTSANNIGRLQLNDSTRLLIKGEGTVKIEEKSVIFVNSGAILQIEAGGLLQSLSESKIVIRNGGILRINRFGILNMIDNSELVVEPGGRIIVDEGAILRLVDGVLTDDGRCKITIKNNGIFRYNGEWKHQGNGYIQFDHNSKLDIDVDKDFSARGFMKEVRFLRLNQYCHLNIICQGVSLGRGRIDMEPSSDITTEASIHLDSLGVQGTVGYAPQKNNAHGFITKGGIGNKVTTNFCNFKDIEAGIRSDAWAKLGLELLDMKRRGSLRLSITPCIWKVLLKQPLIQFI